MKICTSCGAQIKDGSKFCSYCGTRQEEKPEESQWIISPEEEAALFPEVNVQREQPENAPEPAEKRGSAFGILIGIGAVVLAFSLGFFIGVIL